MVSEGVFPLEIHKPFSFSFIVNVVRLQGLKSLVPDKNGINRCLARY